MISERFTNGKTAKRCYSVGDIMRELSRIPADTPIRNSFEDSIDVVLFNANHDDAHVAFEDGGLWDEDDD